MMRFLGETAIEKMVKFGGDLGLKTLLQFRFQTRKT